MFAKEIIAVVGLKAYVEIGIIFKISLKIQYQEWRITSFGMEVLTACVVQNSADVQLHHLFHYIP
jgi:hypothetical protein